MQNNIDKDKLTFEQKLVILCSRLTFYDKQNELIEQLKIRQLDWFKILTYCIKNKVVSLVWSNVKKLHLELGIPNPVYDMFEYHTYMTGLRNEIMINEAHNVQKILMENDIKVIPLKGLIMIPTIYENSKIRHMNDIDMMLDFGMKNFVAKPMSELGFIQGRPNRFADKIDGYSRTELIAWGMKINNMPLFTKMKNEPYARFIEIDFTFGIDFNRENEAVPMMLSKSFFDKETNFECLDKIDFFIHLCAHLYKEATNAVWIIYYQDINLIKFCDVREYFLKYYDIEWFQSVVNRAEQLDALKAVYYSLYYSFILFDDDEYMDCLDKMKIDDKMFLNGFGLREWGKMYEWKKSFYERIFSQSNDDEIAEKPEITLI